MNLPSELDADHRIVYEMVAGRMLETFSGACVKENTSLTPVSYTHLGEVKPLVTNILLCQFIISFTTDQ